MKNHQENVFDELPDEGLDSFEPDEQTIEEDIPVKTSERSRQSSKSTTKKGSSSTKNKPTHQKKKKSKVPLIIAIVAILLIVSAVSKLGKSSSTESSVSRSAESSTASEPKIAMVNVVNMAYPAALNVLQSAGFTNITSNIEPGADESQWVVTEQSVNAGKTIKAAVDQKDANDTNESADRIIKRASKKQIPRRRK